MPIVASSMISLYFLELTDVLQPAKVGFPCPMWKRETSSSLCSCCSAWPLLALQ
ncbi:hypothetical protein M9458_003887, partial [Cirrhinus mrigala]